MENLKGNADKKFMTTSKKDKTNEHWNMWRRKEKSNSTGERRKTKKLSRYDKTIHTEHDIPTQREKVGGECTKRMARKQIRLTIEMNRFLQKIDIPK